MARIAVNFTTNTSTIVATAQRPRTADGYLATVFIYGTFGAGTLAVELSPDRGTTWVPAQNSSGTAITATAAATFNLTLGCGNSLGDGILIRGTLSGATAPNLNLVIFDNKA